VCGNCGTVEAVNAIKRQGQVNGVAVGETTIGLGTVAGGLIGGLLGNQVGGGNGKTAATILGVAGGAYAGSKVEQNMNSVTVYDVRVRMQDGSVRNIEVSSPVSVGTQVTVEGKNIRLATAAG
jgi:outer membrane lipoprotein SlyB